MRTDCTIKEIAFLADLAELCARYKVTLQSGGLGRRDFVGPQVYFKVDDDFAIAVEQEQTRARAFGRPGKALQLKPAELTVTKAAEDAE